MSHKYTYAKDDFSAVNINNYESKEKSQNVFFKYLVLNTFVVLVLLITILYPPKLYKKFVVKFFSIQLSLKNIKIKIYHILLIIISIYVTLYFYLKMQHINFVIESHATYAEKVLQLREKRVVESEIWMIFLIIISLVSIYRNAHLFNREIQNEEKIIKINEEIRKKNKKE